MEVIMEIDDRLLGYKNEVSGNDQLYKLRKASRAVVLNGENEIAVLHIENGQYHKLPGGGFEETENSTAALKREVLEEVGARIEAVELLGIAIEYKERFNQIQISYAFMASAVGDIEQPSFTDKEKKDGISLKWFSLAEAEKKLANDRPQNYIGSFIQQRDLAILQSAMKKTK